MNKKLNRILIPVLVWLILSLAAGVLAFTGEPRALVCDGTHHTDADDNGRCDGCEANLLLAVNVYAINDLHGSFMDDAYQPGVDELTTYLQEHREGGILLSSGDMWQGSSESNLTGGRLITEWMNEMGFDSMTLGNHEFDWGTALIEENAALADFPLLAINVYSRETKQRLPYVSPSVMVEKNGVTLGIIGAVGDVYSSIASYMVEDVYFITGKELTKLVKAEAEKLRAQGADIIVFSVHDGRGSFDKALADCVDIVFEGHTHSYYALRDAQGLFHLQGGGENEGITYAVLQYNYITGTVTVAKALYVPNSVYAHASSSPLRDELYAKYGEDVAKGEEVLGRIEGDMDSDSLRQLVADLYRETGEKAWGSQYDIVMGGGYISIRSPYCLTAGPVLYSELLKLFPFDNRLVLCKIKGSDLRKRFLEVGNSNYFASLTEYGKTVRNQLEDDGDYYIVIDRYSSQYEPNKCTEVALYDDGIYARDLLAEYFRRE